MIKRLLDLIGQYFGYEVCTVCNHTTMGEDSRETMGFTQQFPPGCSILSFGQTFRVGKCCSGNSGIGAQLQQRFDTILSSFCAERKLHIRS